MESLAFLTLRIVTALFFLQPLKNLIKNWSVTVRMVMLIIPFKPNFFAVMMIVVMIVGSVSILLGIYAQIGAALLLIYSLMGIVVHYRLGQQVSALQLSSTASVEDQKTLGVAKTLGVIGHMTSANKNIVIAAALWMIVLLGSGPLSIMGNLW